ncbi:MAG: A/G-specific adenine glycosylase [Odoribacteraceae bacterium]|jgi:A/G-specific adenine glycosylase|nr:A/G-specific adenine glycosylase [Odoribacteraceae bacterium]
MGREIGEILIAWYEVHRRELPWRETRDPYLIWVSEVILQQTRVAQGLDYYYHFTRRFPDVLSLAGASEDEVLKYWQGLGYYSRARNMHAAAREMMSRFGGVFPTTFEEVLSLKGVGEYTAAAICSFAYRLPHATVDGNVYRVLARLFGVDIPVDNGEGKRYFTALARELMVEQHPDRYNQAMMEFGALQCTPQSPGCGECPLQEKCVALATRRVDQLPVKQGKTTVKPRYFNYLHIHRENVTLLSKRTAKDIWQNLYEFPLIETDRPLEFDELCRDDRFRYLLEGVTLLRVQERVAPKRHILSHRVIHARFYDLEVSAFSTAMQAYLQVPDHEMEKYAVSRLIQYYMEHLAATSKV